MEENSTQTPTTPAATPASTPPTNPATNQTPISTTPPPPPSENNSTEVKPKGSGMRSKMILILVIVLLVIILAAGGVFFMRMRGANTSAPVTDQTTEVTEEPITEPSPTSSSSAELTTYTSNKMEELSYSGYTLQYPAGWTETTDKNEISTSLKLQKGSYSINITQAPVGGAPCEEKDNDVIVNESIPLTRRGDQVNTNGKITFNLCMSKIGTAYYESANPPDEAVILEMDNIMKTIEAL